MIYLSTIYYLSIILPIPPSTTLLIFLIHFRVNCRHQYTFFQICQCVFVYNILMYNFYIEWNEPTSSVHLVSPDKYIKNQQPRKFPLVLFQSILNLLPTARQPSFWLSPPLISFSCSRISLKWIIHTTYTPVTDGFRSASRFWGSPLL